MKYGVHLYPFWRFPDLPSIVEFVRRAEQAGYSSVNIPEHTAFPRAHERTMGRVWWDPIVLAAHLANATRNIRLTYSVLVLPQHNPIHLAKQIATLDWVSNGRIDAGVGVGWLKEEIELMGADFHKRGVLTEEYIQAMKALWTTDPSVFRGKFLKFSDVSFHPKPVQRPHPPILVGGGLKTSARRAAALGDGWIPNTTKFDDFKQGLVALKEELRRNGRSVAGFDIVGWLPLFDRDPAAVEHSTMSGSIAPGYIPTSFNGDYAKAAEYVQECAGLGVTVLTVDLPGGDYGRMVREMETFATRVIHGR